MCVFSLCLRSTPVSLIQGHLFYNDPVSTPQGNEYYYEKILTAPGLCSGSLEVHFILGNESVVYGL